MLRKTMIVLACGLVVVLIAAILIPGMTVSG